MSRAIWIGGPHHGKVLSYPDGATAVNVAVADGKALRAAYAYETVNVVPPCSSLLCQVRNLPLAPGKRITYVHHPEIEEDTARMYIADLVIGQWNKYVADSRNRF